MHCVVYSISVVFHCLVSANILKSSPLSMQVCFYNGQMYPLGPFRPSVCVHCHCDSSGHVTCEPEFCPPSRCVDFIKDPSKCCPVCPNGRNCRVSDAGNIIKYGETHFDGSMICHCPEVSLEAECIYV